METSIVHLPLDGLSCEHCADRVGASLRAATGVQAVEFESGAGRLLVRYRPELITAPALVERARQVEAEIGTRVRHERFDLVGLDCADCAATLAKAIRSMPGVLHAEASHAAAILDVGYESSRVGREKLVGYVRDLGYAIREPAVAPQCTEFRLSGLDCADCAVTVERAVQGMPGVASARVDFAAGRLMVEHQTALPPASIVRVVEDAGYHAVVAGAPVVTTSFWSNRRVQFTGAALGCFVAALLAGLFGTPAIVATLLYAAAIVVGGYPIARAALFGVVRARTLDVNVLMTLAVTGAVAIGEWSEAAAVVVLFALGNALEAYTNDRARGAIRALIALRPSEARVLRGGREVAVPVDAVRVGERFVVRPGESIPLDGLVADGASVVDQAPITGESIPIEKRPGDEVFAGTINGSGWIEVSATKPASENVINRIARIVAEAQARKAPFEQLVDRFARVYTPVVIAVAVALAVVPWQVFGEPFEPWFYRALVVLVVACPCALVISTPAAIVAGLARAASLGVLIKGGAHLEALGALRAFAFDKTGTLSIGRPEVVMIAGVNGRSTDEVLAIAAAVESRSEHPLARAVLRRAGHRGAHRTVTDFSPVVGRGAMARVDGVMCYVGNETFFRDMGLAVDPVTAPMSAIQQEGQTALLVGMDDEVIGIIGVTDRVRPNAASTIARLRRAGIERVVMLTGDHDRTAATVAREVAVDEFQASLLPEQKLEAVRALERRYGPVGVVGDGVNDAPALAGATVGVAMGGAGTDAALETAPVTLMADDLGQLPAVIRLSRTTVRTIRQNIVFSLVVKVLFLALASTGLVTLWLAIVADVGASLVVTLNSMRLLRYRVPDDQVTEDGVRAGSSASGEEVA